MIFVNFHESQFRHLYLLFSRYNYRVEWPVIAEMYDGMFLKNSYPANIYLFKVRIETLEIVAKYVQS